MDEVEIVGPSDTRKTTATDIEMFRVAGQGDGGRQCRRAGAGHQERGWSAGWCWRSRSITPHKVHAECMCRRTKAGAIPFFQQISSQFYFRTSDDGQFTLPEGVEMVMPGDNVSVEIEVIAPVAMKRASASPFARAADHWCGRVSEVMK
jgi:elongation factor Tu